MLNSFSIPLPSPSSAALLAPPAMVSGGTPRTPRSKSSGNVGIGGGAASPSSSVATFVEQYNVCNSLDNKHSSGYHSILGRGDVFGAYMDTRSTHIASTLLPPGRTAFVDSEGRCEVLCCWKMVPSVSDSVAAAKLARAQRTLPGGAQVPGQQQHLPATTAAVAAAPKKSNAGGAHRGSVSGSSGSNITLPNEYLTKLRSVDFLWEALGITTTQTEGQRDASGGVGGTGGDPTTTGGTVPSPLPLPAAPPRALFVVTSFQHTSVYAIPVVGGSTLRSSSSTGDAATVVPPTQPPPPTAASGHSDDLHPILLSPSSAVALGPELLQTWTIPNAGRRCTANAVTILGAMLLPASSPPAAGSPDAASVASTSAVPPYVGGVHGAPTTVTILCEALMVLGFERGDVLFCGIASERIHRRVNCPAASSTGGTAGMGADSKRSPTTATSTSSASTASFASHQQQLIPHPVACITEIQSSAQNSLRGILSRRGGQRTGTPSADVIRLPRRQHTPGETNALDSSSFDAAAGAYDDRCESIYAIGFDDGSILVCTVTMSCAAPTMVGGGAADGSSPMVSPGAAGVGAASWSVQLRHHMNFGTRPIHCIEPSIPPFFVLLWSAHSAPLAQRLAATEAAAGSVGSPSASLTDPPTLLEASYASMGGGSGGSGGKHSSQPPVRLGGKGSAAASVGDTTSTGSNASLGGGRWPTGATMPTTKTTLTSLHLLYGADADWDEDVPPTQTAQQQQHHPPTAGVNHNVVSPTPPRQAPPSPLVPVASPLYAAIAAEGGGIYIVELPTLEKRTSVSNLIDDGVVGSGCGDYFTLQWIPRGAVRSTTAADKCSNSNQPHHHAAANSAANAASFFASSLALQPELLVAGGASDELNVFAIGDTQRGQFRRAYAPPTAWGVVAAATAPTAAHAGPSSQLATRRNEGDAERSEGPHPQQPQQPEPQQQRSLPGGVSLRLVQRLPFHRNWINRLCLLPVASAPTPPAPTSSLLAGHTSTGSTTTDGYAAVLPACTTTGGGSVGEMALMVVATSLDDTISFWPVLAPPAIGPQQAPPLTSSSSSSQLLRRLSSAGGGAAAAQPRGGGPSSSSGGATPSSSPPDRLLNRPPPLQHPHHPHEPSAPHLQQHVGIAEEPALVVSRCHEDLVVASAVCDAGRFGSVFVTVCLRGRVRFWMLSDPQL